jgi:N-acetylmuramoyl-L-alanine amidase
MLRGLVYLIFASGAIAGTFTVEGRKVTVATMERAGTVFFQLDPVLQACGLLREPYRAGKGFQVVHQDRLLVLGEDSAFVVLDGEIQQMEAPPILEGGNLFMPAGFFTGPLADLLNGQIRASGVVLSLSDVRKKEVPALTAVEVHYLGGFTKAVLVFKQDVAFSVKEGARQVLIQFPKPIQYAGGPLQFNDPLVESCLVKDRSVLITLKQENTTLSTYSLSNPFRIVLDIARSGVKPTTSGAPPPAPRFLVVIDPGHGGEDAGARGSTGALEKDITLAIARKMQSFLVKAGLEVLLTRTSDTAVGLEDRAAFANNRKGNLFLSLHLNAHRVNHARGSETFFMSLEGSEAGDAAGAPSDEGLVAPNDAPLEFILWELAQSEYLKDSSRFAEMVQEEMDRLYGLEKRGVKQAPFRVLAGVTMPAALVEIGFLTNAEEERRLVSESFQDQVAQGLVQAVLRFKEEIGERWRTASH